jgi:hypothetical protein
MNEKLKKFYEPGNLATDSFYTKRKTEISVAKVTKEVYLSLAWKDLTSPYRLKGICCER